MSKKIAIIQSCYIPWKGYFDIINRVDEFVIFDDVQYTRRDWRNRNKIKTAQGLKWLTIPVETKGRYDQLVSETEVSNETWARQHWRAIEHNYRKAPGFTAFAGQLAELYVEAGRETLLSSINLMFLAPICALLGITTPLTRSQDYGGQGSKTERLVGICRAAGADAYLTGPSARNYLELEKFEAQGIAVEFADYSGYKEYRQLYGPFEHNVSIVDLLLNEGDEAREYLASTP